MKKPLKKNLARMMKIYKTAFSLFCLFVFSLCSACWVSAEEVDPKVAQEAKGIYSSIMSPFCPGRLLSDCPSSAAVELKDEIHDRVASGASKREIIAELYQKYGDEIRAVPTTEGFGLVGWLVPLVFLLGGFCFILVWLHGQKKQPES